MKTPQSVADIVRRLSRPLEPIPTGQQPLLAELSGIRAVLFDVYGTLFINGSGEVGTPPEAACWEGLEGALGALGVEAPRPMDQGADYLFESIKASHAEAHQRGIKYPEVDIVQIWRQVVQRLMERGILPQRKWPRKELERLAVQYECRANPVWPMPGLQECLRALSQKGLLLGIVSNAQFYTPELFPALLGAAAERWGFDPSLQYYSFRYGRAKPGRELHQMAADCLRRRHVRPEQGVFVGNDMLNDILPASRVGFRTALFAGDARSLRRRDGDPRLDGVSPDLVLTGLDQLNRCV